MNIDPAHRSARSFPISAFVEVPGRTNGLDPVPPGKIGGMDTEVARRVMIKVIGVQKKLVGKLEKVGSYQSF